MDTSFDRYVLGACGSNSGLARMILEKIQCRCIGDIIQDPRSRSKTVVLQQVRENVYCRTTCTSDSEYLIAL